MLQPGQEVGPIRLLSRIGAGGMGEVWEGVDERLGRRVAVKTIRRTAGSDAVARARFAREARILSRLEHPNVCRLYEYLHTDELDLLVLELVNGRPLSQAIAAGLADGERLEIALGVVSALLAAHALSVVHRDLKPDNVMLAEDGSVKVLDFGIARRLLDGDAVTGPNDPIIPITPTDPIGPIGPTTRAAPGDAAEGAAGDHLTVAGDVLGTPRYMSPEQARGEPATAASDMFCFGLLLFELYTGRAPYAGGTIQETLTRAQWGDVPPAAGVDRAVAALIRDLSQLEPGRRPTAQQALERLRALQRRPVRRLKAAAALIAAVSLVAGTALSLVGLSRARREAAVADATTEFLLGLFEGSDPQQAPDPEVKARAVLDRGAARLREQLREQPATRARLLVALGGIYGNLGLHRDARTLLEEALALQEGLEGRDDPALLPVLNRLGNALAGVGEVRPAEEVLRRAVGIASHAGVAAEEAVALNLLASLLSSQGRLDEAEPVARRAAEMRERIHGPDDPRTAAALANLALIEIDRGRSATAEPMLQRALEILERRHGPDHPDVASVVNNLATARKNLGRLTEAETLYRRALASLTRRLGAAHPQIAVVRNDLAVVLLEQRRYREAEEQYREAAAAAGKALGVGHPLTAIVTANLAESCLLQARAAEAEPLYRQALGALRAVFGEQHPAVADALRGLGLTCAALGRAEEAEGLLLDAGRLHETISGPDSPELGKVLTQLGSFYLDQDRADAARPVLARARGILESRLPADHPTRKELEAALRRLPPASGTASDPGPGSPG